LDSLASIYFPVGPTKYGFNLADGDYITNNLELAYVRAYMIKQRIEQEFPFESIQFAEPTRYSIGAKANDKKGGQFRRVAAVFVIEGFYTMEGELPAESLAIDDSRLDTLTTTQIRYDTIGYPNGQYVSGIPVGRSIYKHCPCLD